MAGEADITISTVYVRLGDFIVTTNERFRQIENRMDSGFDAVNARISGQQYVHIDRYLADDRAHVEKEKQQDAEIAELKANSKWQSRTLALAVLAFIGQTLTGVVLFAIGVGR